MTAQPRPSEWVSVREASRRLKWSEYEIRNLVERGGLTAREVDGYLQIKVAARREWREPVEQGARWVAGIVWLIGAVALGAIVVWFVVTSMAGSGTGGHSEGYDEACRELHLQGEDISC